MLTSPRRTPSIASSPATAEPMKRVTRCGPKAATVEPEWRKFQREQLAAQAAAKAAQSSGGSSSGYDIASEYNGLRKSGASTQDSDAYLKAAIAAGLISERDATELRNSRYGSSKSGSSATSRKSKISGFPNR